MTGSTLRLAVLGDVHGNLEAFEACLDKVDGIGVDRVVIAGDLVNGAPDSRACWDLALNRGFDLLRGNHERYLFDQNTSSADPSWRSERFAPIRWAAAQFEQHELEQMRRLPLCYRDALAPDLLIVHASVRSDNEAILAFTPESVLDEAFAGSGRPALIVRAHNHLPYARPWGDSMIVSAGAVGMPLDGTTAAKFVLLERDGAGRWRYQHVAVPYDVDKTVERFRSSGYLEAGGAMTRLILREVATGTHQMTPFMRYWEKQIPRVSALDEAVELFLTAY